MLVIISDLHLTDGTSGATISPNAFRIFAERLQDLAVSASWRIDDTYRPIESIDLLLLGDVLDVIRSAQWLIQERLRPWGDTRRADFAEFVSKLTGDILTHNDAAFGVFRDLASGRLCALPPANAAKQPVLSAQPQPLPVRIFYLVGNHDWFYTLHGQHFDKLRQTVIRQLGLAHPTNEPFPHDPAEHDMLSETLRRHKVFARHGDVFDPFNFTGDRAASSLGDCIVIELLNRFAFAVETELSNELPPATIAGLREIDNIRPLLLVPVWIDGLLERTCPYPAQRRRVKQVWDELVDRFLDLHYVRQQDTWRPGEMVDGLQGALKFSKHVSIHTASMVISWFNKIRGTETESYYKHALAEQDFRNRRAKHIVYGHTHYAETVPLDASYAEGYVLNQVYFNSGTWRRVHRQTELAPREHEFIPSDVMTYLAFFQGDERRGRGYESWSGTLGTCPSDIPTRRIDTVQTNARIQPVSAPVHQIPAPHFATSPARRGIVPARRV